MPTVDAHAPGTFSWVDLAARDLTEALPWYAARFGWTAGAPDASPGPPYAMWSLRGHLVAGCGQLSEAMQAAGRPPTWNSYVTVEDADAVAARAEALGGSVVVPGYDIPGAGRMAFLATPEGAVFGVWEPHGHIGSGLVTEPGAFCWNELCSRDPDAAAAFLGGLFGWTTREVPSGAPTRYLTLANDGRDNGGILEMSADWGDVPSAWSVYFAVDDVDAFVRDATDAGATVFVPPLDTPVGRMAGIADPQGAMFHVIALAAPAG